MGCDQARGYHGDGVSPLLTTREVAAMLGMSPASVLRRWRSGELPGYRIGSNVLRFRTAELEAWLEARHQPADTGNPDAAAPT